MSFAPTTRVGYEGGLAHDRQILDKITKSGAEDGGGFTAKVQIPDGAIKSDTVEIGGVDKTKSGASGKKMLSTGILLAGGALIGYLCSGSIKKGIDFVKDKAGQFMAQGKPAELLATGKGLLEKVKNAIFAK